MRSLVGHPVNVRQPKLGKVVLQSPWLSCKRSTSVIVTNTPNRKSLCHSMVLTDADNIATDLRESGKPICYGVNRLGELRTGDVVRLNPDGRVDVLYEKKSFHNVLFVTEQCNCSCLTCPQYTKNSKSDYTEQVLTLIKLIDPHTKNLGITGGEPTLLGEKLFSIIKACKQRLPKTSLQLLSNGIRLADFEFCKSLALIGHPALQIGIPLYADTDMEHNNIVQADAFYKTLKGIQNLALFKLPVEIRTVISALNYRRIPKLAEFVYRNLPFAIHVAFMGMETRELAKKNLDQVWIDPYDYQDHLYEAVRFLSLRQMNISIYNHQLCLLPESLWRFARKSISTWKNIYLDECDGCSKRKLCGGFFESSAEVHSRHIHRI